MARGLSLYVLFSVESTSSCWSGSDFGPDDPGDLSSSTIIELAPDVRVRPRSFVHRCLRWRVFHIW
jgi:hypothetical protein